MEHDEPTELCVHCGAECRPADMHAQPWQGAGPTIETVQVCGECHAAYLAEIAEAQGDVTL